jgi:signal transduction histidine kinase
MDLDLVKKTKILLVEANTQDIQTIREAIDEEVEIQTFLDAKSALTSMPEHQYGFAILDMQMPDMSGLELSRRIRAIKDHSHLPIIFLTDQHNTEETITQDHVTGAVDFLFKPLNPAIVRSKVRMFVELQRHKHQMQLQLRELERLRIAAEAATLAKSQFLANMSHEIRTPLAAVMGFADLIARGLVPEEKIDECASSIRRNGNLLMRLIDDILDLSKIEANHIEMEIQNTSLKDLLEDIEFTLSFKAREKGINLIFNRPEFNQEGHLFDPTRMKQILLNIIGNAIKFTHKGKVRVDAAIVNISETHDKLTIVVQNDGIGITKEQAARLFQPFEQAEVSVKRKFGGSGLGLVISRQLAQAMGGDVVLLKSEADSGTEFEISVILERSQQTKLDSIGILKSSFEAEEISANFQGKHILAVDDARDNLILLEMFLRETEASITFAKNGLEALELCLTNKYDIILMDIQMPKMDGIEATAAIRAIGTKIPILALTAYTTKTEYDRCRKAGCNDTLTKPISKNNLIKALVHYLLPR